MTDSRNGARLGIFNVRGLKKRLHEVDELATEAAVLGICETWARVDDDPITEILDVSASAPPVINLNRGYGGVGVIINPLLQYDVRDKYVTSTVQSVTVKVSGTTIPVIYISPRATAEEELRALDRLHKLAGTRAVIMGDLNARHTSWDTQSNARGRRIARWARQKLWHICGPEQPSFRSPRGSSAPDIFIVKGTNTYMTTTRSDMDMTGSDHFPVEIIIQIHHDEGEKEVTGHTPRKQRQNPRLLLKAQEHYAQNLPGCLKQATETTTSTDLEEAYRRFKETILNPWETARKGKPNRFKPW